MSVYVRVGWGCIFKSVISVCFSKPSWRVDLSVQGSSARQGEWVENIVGRSVLLISCQGRIRCVSAVQCAPGWLAQEILDRSFPSLHLPSCGRNTGITDVSRHTQLFVSLGIRLTSSGLHCKHFIHWDISLANKVAFLKMPVIIWLLVAMATYEKLLLPH